MSEKFSSVDDDFKKLVAFCLKNGIQKYKKTMGPVLVELEFHPSALFPESNYKKKKREEQGEVPVDAPAYLTDPEAAIDWSSGGIPRNE